MRHRFAVLLVLLLCGIAVCAQAEYVVGTDIAGKDITDFYYTLSASTYPPVYQRYRFCRENGKKLFYHESRQGGGWPQTEEDIVASGTRELTEKEWSAFVSCLRGGTVTGRSDEVIDGDEGPWMYLYWTGDEGTIQEFRFASPAEENEFIELCSGLAQNHILTYFRFSRGGYMVPQSWEITLHNGGYTIQRNDDEPRVFDPDLVAELLKVIESNNLESWNGFHESDPDVLDGEGFMLEMRFADGTSVYASGDNAFPDNYSGASDGIEAIMEKEEMSRIAGTYRYEGEGFGGDFTITLNPDGTYTFYEGPLSSYIGGGTWYVYYRTVYMTETNGYDLQFMFDLQDDALAYYAVGSDAFPYAEVSDGERFVRQDMSGAQAE